MHNPRFCSAAVLAALLCSLSAPARAEPPAPADPAAATDDAKPAGEGGGEAGGEVDPEVLKQAIESQLKWQTGDVVVGNGLATFKLGEQWRYLDPEQAQFVLTELWGNPPGEPGLGMIFPKDVGPVDKEGWGVIVEFSEDGYVEDDDADDIDYSDLLTEMRDDAKASNAQRKEAGYPSVNIVGWAEPPHYDKGSRKLYWAKEIAFEGNEENTLNYDVRILGRRGYLVLQAVSGMSQIGAIKTAMTDILPRAEFNPTHRYEDFDPDLDKVAAYGIGALVAGKLAAKTGLLAAVGVMLLKAKKLLIVGAIAVAALVKRLLGNKEG